MTLSWSELVLVDRIAREHATDLFSEWPWSPSAVLEVRRCACGELVTRVIEPNQTAPQIACAHQPKISDGEFAAISEHPARTSSLSRTSST